MSLTLKFVFYLYAITTVCNAAPSGTNKIFSMGESSTKSNYRDKEFRAATDRALNPNAPAYKSSSPAEERDSKFEALQNKYQTRAPYSPIDDTEDIWGALDKEIKQKLDEANSQNQQSEENNQKYISANSESSGRNTKADSNVDWKSQKPKSLAERLEKLNMETEERRRKTKKEMEEVLGLAPERTP